MCRKLLQFVIGCGKLGEGLDKWIRGGSVRVGAGVLGARAQF